MYFVAWNLKFSRREGNIVAQFLDNNSLVISDPEEVSKLVISSLQAIQDNPNMDKYINALLFPDLPKLNKNGCIKSLNRLTSGKAISVDLFSDLFLKKKNLKEKLEL